MNNTKTAWECGTVKVLKKKENISKKAQSIKTPKKFDELKLKLLLLNGPNLNMLGKRDPKQYGTFTLREAESQAGKAAFSRGYKLDCFQSNHEGAIIDKIHEAQEGYDGIVINPGALTHYSYAIRDAIELCPLPVVETHISDISKREEFRSISVTAPVCCACIKGLGIKSYSKAIEVLCDIIEKNISNEIK